MHAPAPDPRAHALAEAIGTYLPLFAVVLLAAFTVRTLAPPALRWLADPPPTIAEDTGTAPEAPQAPGTEDTGEPDPEAPRPVTQEQS